MLPTVEQRDPIDYARCMRNTKFPMHSKNKNKNCIDKTWWACLLSISIVSLTGFSSASHATQPYLEDADSSNNATSNSASANIDEHLWPRIMMAETQTLAGDPEQFSKYRIIAASAHSVNRMLPLQEENPDLIYFRTVNPNEYLGYNDESATRVCPQGHGNSFMFTTAASGDCGVYAGHWLYQPGAHTTNSITASSNSVRVSDISRFSNGDYVVIYNAPAGSFDNAEHARITSINNSTSTLNLERGFKSNAVAHANGSIIAQHARGFGNPNPQNWRYNLSTQSPRDANGLTYGQFLPMWIEDNITTNLLGEDTDVNVSGILFDSDFSFLFNSEDVDANNDLLIDNGISPSGTNWWGIGMEQFYDRVRARFPNLILSGGVRDTRAFDSLNGTQFEGFPGFSDFFSPDPEYDNLASLLTSYSLSTRHRDVGPTHSHVLSKTPSRIYPFNENPSNTTNRTFRFALGLTLLENGYFGFRNSSDTPDVWFDEYAVDITRGSSDFGRAIPSDPNDEAKVRAHLGWLGRPSGTRHRVYSDSEFATQEALLSGTFNSNINGWEGQQVNISRTTSVTRDGAGALRVSPHTGGYQRDFGDAGIRGPLTSTTNGREYTFVFSARASQIREISASIGGHSERFYLRPEWQRYVMTFRATEGGSTRPRFNVGRENTEIFIDTVHFFEGNANIFRRDFDNGIVVVNATPSPRTISLDGTFQRIRGQQDSAFNNGASVSNLTLDAYDSAILVRLENQQPETDVQAPWINITSPTKLQVGAITNTSIVVRDQLAINASDVRLSPNNTAGVSNLNCTQASVNRVNCSLSITSTGDLVIRATDVAGNRSDETEAGFQINGGTTGDGTAPVMIITAPTLVSNGPITNTTVRITDNIEIRAEDIEFREANTVDVTNFNCQQSSTTVVNCTMRIISSGTLSLIATDLGGNTHRASVSGYVINDSGSGGGGGTSDTSRPDVQITAPTKTSNQTIRDTTIVVTDDRAINLNDVELRASSTAATTNFRCLQDGARTVRCTIDIVSSGDITLLATDEAGNEMFRSERDYQINNTGPSDTTRPDIQITAPTKSSNGVIRDTTILVTDNQAIDVDGVELRASSTAGTSNFSCQQDGATRVRCSVNITSSGDITLLATDESGNELFRSERDYEINLGDTQQPIFIVSSPNRISNSTILDTVITVRDDLAIDASDVRVRDNTTLGYSAFNCQQRTQTEVVCSLNITSSGDLLLVATDAAGNSGFRTESGYRILNDALYILPLINMILEE